MRSFLMYILVLVALFGTVLQGCKKKSPLAIDNNQIIQKPFTLYAADTFGALWHTNDGENFVQVPGAGAGGGIETRAIMISDTNIIFIQFNAHVSDDGGKNFNPIAQFDNIGPNPNTFWQSMIIDVPAFNRVYMSGVDGKMIYSDSSGRRGTWRKGSADVTSFAVLKDGTFVTFSNTGSVNYLTSVNGNWASPPGPPSLAAASGGGFFITNFGNGIVAGDYLNGGGVWYLEAMTGATWQQFTGLPADARILSMVSAFDQSLLVGTDKYGVYRVVPKLSTKFEPSNEGLYGGILVKGLTAKSNVYKNGAVKQYIFASTNKGIFRSEDLGQNWVQVFERNCTAIY